MGFKKYGGRMKRTLLFLLAVGMMVVFTHCEKEEDFYYDMELLTGTQWGIPQIQETGPAGGNFIQSSPTVFYEDGRVSFGGNSDFWQVRNSRSLLIQQREQIWQILDLTENKLHVEVLTYPDSKFVVRAIFYPVEK